MPVRSKKRRSARQSGAEPGQHQPDRAEPLPRSSTGLPVREHRRGDRDDRDRLVLDDLQRALRVEAVDRAPAGPLAQHLPSTAFSP